MELDIAFLSVLKNSLRGLEKDFRSVGCQYRSCAQDMLNIVS